MEKVLIDDDVFLAVANRYEHLISRDTLRQILEYYEWEKHLKNLPSTKPEGVDIKYLIWSNEHNAWWRPNHSGYTTHIEGAGRYSFDEAIKICNGANYSWDMDMVRPNELPISEVAAQHLTAKE